MSFGGTKKKTTTGTQVVNSSGTSQQDASSGKEQWARTEGQNIYQAAKDAAYQPYQAYGGERVAGYDGNFDQALGMVKDMAGQNQNLGTATSILDSIRSSLDPNVSVSSLMNPYVDATLNPQIRKINEALAGARANADATSTMSGAFGDTGAAMNRSLLQRDATQQIADTTGQAYYTAYDKAQAQKNTIMQQLMQLPGAYTAVDQAATAKGTGLANMLAGFSDKTRQVQQQKDNAGYSDFLESRDWNQNQMTKLMAMLNATPVLNQSSQKGSTTQNSVTNSTQTQSEPDNSGFGILGSLLGSALSLGTGGMSSMMGAGVGGLSSLFGASGGAYNFMPSASLGAGKDSDWV